ncbi:hypothetical protein D9M72_579440 [compost metagenome]
MDTADRRNRRETATSVPTSNSTSRFSSAQSTRLRGAKPDTTTITRNTMSNVRSCRKRGSGCMAQYLEVRTSPF